MERVLVVGRSIFSIRLGASSSNGRMKVTITLDGRTEWTFDHASWRPLAVGLGSGLAYVWSAREIVVLPEDINDEPSVVEVDEDLLFVFRIEVGWLLVCETSVRLVTDQEEVSRLELGDVVERARWNEGRLLIEDARGVMVQIEVTDSRLTYRLESRDQR
jgi:hypothetical protein